MNPNLVNATDQTATKLAAKLLFALGFKDLADLDKFEEGSDETPSGEHQPPKEK